VVGEKTRRSSHLLVGATLTIGTAVIGNLLTSSLSGEQSLWSILGWSAAGISVTFLYLRWQLQSQEESPEAIKGRVSQLATELREQVQARSYGARRNLIEAPLRELDLDVTPRLGWIRDPRAAEPEPVSSEKKIAGDIVAAFKSSKRRLLIVGEPGSGKTMAAYSLIEHLDETEGNKRIPLLINLSAWEPQEDFEAFLVDYLCSFVGYKVRERALANAFIRSRRYSLILDGLDEIPARLGEHFSERLDAFVEGLLSEVAVVVTCRTKEYKALRENYPLREDYPLPEDFPRGLGLVQAVEILPLPSEQLDSALRELAKFDEDWRAFLSQRDLTACQRARDVLSNPLFLNLAVVGRLRPRQLLLECDEEQEVRGVVLDSYLDRTLADQRDYEPEAARGYLSWIAHFLNGDKASPFGHKTSDHTVFDLADLTPPDPPRPYLLFEGLVLGLILGLVLGGVDFGLGFGLGFGWPLGVGLVLGLFMGLAQVLSLARPTTWRGKRFRLAVRRELTLVWPSTRRQLVDILPRAGRALAGGLAGGLVLGLLMGGLDFGLGFGLVLGLGFGLVMGLPLGLLEGLNLWRFETESVLITSRTPKEARSRSLIAAVVSVVFGLGLGLGLSLVLVFAAFMVWRQEAVEATVRDMLVVMLRAGLPFGLVFGLLPGLYLGMNYGGWFVLLQKVAHRRLARAGNLPPRPDDFLEWGIRRQIFQWVGGGVRFRHNLIQQHLANKTPEGVS
jgi:hypothetical protein